MRRIALLLLMASPSWATYSYTRTLTIDHTKVSTGQGTYSNFPVLVSIAGDITLSTQSTGGHLLNSSGFDIVFSTKDSSCSYLLNWDTETINSTGYGTLNAWVNIPSISSTTDTVFYMCYGNSGITTYQGYSTGTWDSNYKGVWHFPNGTTLTTNDSTSGGHTGTVNGGVTAGSGQIDGAGVFDGTGYINTSPPSSTAMTNFTVSAWFYRNGAQDTSNPAIVSDVYSGNVNYEIEFVGGSQTYIEGGYYNSGWHRSPSIYIGNQTWTYVVLTYNGSTISLSLNAGTPVTTSDSTTPATDNTGMRIGRRWDNPYYIAGTIDEVRISNIARSADWIKTEYNNQNNPNSFTSISIEAPSVTCPSGYSYYRSFTLDNRKIAPSSFNNYAVLISTTLGSFATAGNGGRLQNASGYDLIFTPATNGSPTNVYFDTETYNATSGAINYWVNVSTLPSDGITLYAFYGNSGISTFQGNVNSTWDSNYKGVWHLGNGTTLNTLDSTSNGTNGTNHSVTATTGQDDGAGGFAATYIDLGSPSQLQITGAMTAEAWMYIPSWPTSAETPIICQGYNGSGFGWNLELYGFSNYIKYGTATYLFSNLSTNTWYHIAGVYDGSNSIIYINGVAVATVAGGAPANNGRNFEIGAFDNQGTPGQEPITGTLDEVRVSNTNRSANYLLTDYLTQANQQTAWTVGAETSCGGASPYVPLNRGLVIQGGKTKIQGGKTSVQ